MALGKVANVAVALSEDTPPDLLAGGMDLRVVLPCGSVTRCHVDRSTPIMDLLVELARVHRISPAAHTLQPFGLNNTPLHSQPSTPIGALDVFTVKIVPKARPLAPLGKRPAPRPTPAQPFEQTFRLQVHLPRNQLFVTRASRATVLGDIRQLACGEKNLDPNKYELRHPANLDQRLDPESTLGECGLTEVALVASGGRHGLGGLGLSQPLPDIMALRRQEDKRREAAKAGQFGYLTSHSMAEGSVSSASSGSLGGRSASPAPSDGERSSGSTSPPAVQPLQQMQPPCRPGRKRRPAPKPPVGVAAAVAEEMNNNINKEVIASGGTVISHSRNSSDSSGYHEATTSVLSESPDGHGHGHSHGHSHGHGHGPDSLRSGKLQSCVSQPNLSLSRSMTNLNVTTQQQLSVRGNRNSIAVLHEHHADVVGQGLDRVPGAHRASTSSLATAGQRKKKAPPPPPPAQPAQAPKPAQPSVRPASAGPDAFLKTQSLERQSTMPTGAPAAGPESPADAAPQSPGARLTKSSTLPACSTATAFPPPSAASAASSSCPTPTPSEQSVQLSEDTPTPPTTPAVAPRAAPRVPIASPVALGVRVLPRKVANLQLRPTDSPPPPPSPSPSSSPTSPMSPAATPPAATPPSPAPRPQPLPRPRPRKPAAPTPPTTPTQPAPPTSATLGLGLGTPPSVRARSAATPADADPDVVSDAGSPVLDKQGPPEAADAADAAAAGADGADGLHGEVQVGVEPGSSAAGARETQVSAQPGPEQSEQPERGAVPTVPDQAPQALDTKNGEEADSDLGTDELSPPRSEINDDESSLEQTCDVKTSQNLGTEQSVENSHPPVIALEHNECSSKKSKDEPDSKQNVATDGLPQSHLPVEEEWEYRLPSPPCAFRDDRSHSPTVTEYNSVNLTEANMSTSTGVPVWEDKTPKLSEVEDEPPQNSICHEPEAENVTVASSQILESPPLIPDSKSNQQESLEKEELVKEKLPSNSPLKSPTNETVIKSTDVPSNEGRRKLEGPAAVLDELNKVLKEQRTNNLTTQLSVSSQSESTLQPVHEPAPIENFSMAVYSRPTSAEGMAATEVRPSFVLARRSSFSNSNGSLSTLPRPLGTGVRRTTSHATLVGGRRDISNNNCNQSVENLGSAESGRKYNGTGVHQNSPPMGRAVSEMNLCAGLPMTPLEPELLKEFMEWRQQKQREQLEKDKQQKMAPTQELQSPQLLRTILSQSQDDISGKAENRKENSSGTKISSVPANQQEKEIESSKPSFTIPVSEPVLEPVPEPVPDPIAAPKVEEPVKRNVPRGPPSIQLSTWNERPKRQVSIKSDRDYWIGVGKAALRPTQHIREKSAELKIEETVTDSQNDHNTVQDPEFRRRTLPSEKQNGHTTVISSSEVQSKTLPSSDTVKRLSRQYIVHTTPSGFRRPAEPVPPETNSLQHTNGKITQEKAPSEEEPELIRTSKLVSSVSTGELPDKIEKTCQGMPHQTSLLETTSVEIPVTPKNDPSRVPIVRAVELKKPSVTTDLRKTLQRQNATNNNSVVYFSSGPIATSSVSASTKPVSVNGTTSTKPTIPIKKFTSVVDISGPTNERPANGNTEGQPTVQPIGPSVHVNGFAAHSEPKKALPMPVVKGFKFAQGVVNRQLSAPAATPPPPAPAPSPAPVSVPAPTSTPTRTPAPAPAPAPAAPPPPPAPVMPVLKKVPRPSSLPARVQDPRDQLLDAIRNFGGRTKLRPTT